MNERTKKGRYTWENFPSPESESLTRAFISLIENFEGLVCVTAGWNKKEKSLAILSWMETPLTEDQKEEIYSAEYEAQALVTSKISVGFFVRESIPELTTFIQGWAGLSAIWFKD